MGKRLSKFKAGLIALLLAGSVSVSADEAFKFSGYMRSGGGYNPDMQKVLKTDELHLGRFGNEFDTFVALRLHKKLEFESGAWAEYKAELTQWNDDSNRRSDANRFDRNLVTMGGLDFLPEGATIWAGTDKIGKDIHVLDHKYRDLVGTGFGYKGKTLEFNFVSNDSGLDSDNAAIISGDPNIESQTAELSGYFGPITARGVFTTSSEYDDMDSVSGYSGTITYDMDSYLGVMDGSTTLGALIGSGKSAGQLGKQGITGDEDDTSFKVFADGYLEAGDIHINPVALYESTDYDNGDERTDLVLGGRIHQPVTENLALVYEGFVDMVDYGTVDGMAYKISAGPVAVLSNNYWARPQMRLTATLIGADEELVDAGKYVFNEDGDESEFRLGYQFEVWF